MAYAKIVISHSEADSDIKRLIQSAADSVNGKANRIINYFGALEGGVRKASVEVDTVMVQASGTITFSAVATANDTLIVNGVTFTAKASGAAANEFNIGANATASAANLAASINASVTALVSGYVSASSSAGVVTVVASQYGKMGNLVTIAEGVDGGSVISVSGARLTAGSDGTSKTYSFGGG